MIRLYLNPITLSVFWGLLAGCASTAPLDQAKALVGQAREAEKRGDFEGAVTLYSTAIKTEPMYAPAYFERGYVNIRLRLNPEATGNTREYEDRALLDYSEAIRLDPSLGQAYYNRSMIWSSRGRYRQAAEDLLKAIEYRPQDPEPHLAIAQIYETKFDDMAMKAGDHYEKYADLGGRDQEAREKAKFWKEQKKAAALAPKVPTEEDEKKAQEMHLKAMGLLKDGKRDEALKLVEELLTIYSRTRYMQDPQRVLGLRAMLEAYRKGMPK
jgi:tetratricopeptide (TPR) repeat protein